MQIIGDLFNILLFVTMVGSLLTLLFCILGKVLKLPLPLWFGICCMAAYIVPVTAWGTWLIPPEEHGWVEIYSTLCWIWVGGAILLVLLRAIRSFLGFRAFLRCHLCEENHILDCSHRCSQLAGLLQSPSVFWGELHDPACVLGLLHPVVILNQAVCEQLTDHELTAVLCHEMTHIRRKHMMLATIFDYVCIIHWFNPFVWIMRQEFSVLCEMDCDRYTIAALIGHIPSQEYACALLRLLSLSSGRDVSMARGLGALGFLSAKRRIRQILTGSKGLPGIIGYVLGILGLILAILFSLHMSRMHFYPYLQGPTEYAAESATYESHSALPASEGAQIRMKNCLFPGIFRV